MLIFTSPQDTAGVGRDTTACDYNGKESFCKHKSLVKPSVMVLSLHLSVSVMGQLAYRPTGPNKGKGGGGQREGKQKQNRESLLGYIVVLL